MLGDAATTAKKGKAQAKAKCKAKAKAKSKAKAATAPKVKTTAQAVMKRPAAAGGRGPERVAQCRGFAPR